MIRLQILRVWNQIGQYHRVHDNGINLFRPRFHLNKRLTGTNSFDAPLVCIIGSGPAGFYTAQYLLKVLLPNKP